jgi:hypothetical protein
VSRRNGSVITEVKLQEIVRPGKKADQSAERELKPFASVNVFFRLCAGARRTDTVQANEYLTSTSLPSCSLALPTPTLREAMFRFSVLRFCFV